MTDDTPKWLLVMRAITGLTETPGSADNPKILAMRDYIAQKYPKMATYCNGYQHDDTPWCGLCEAFCMAVADIEPPFGPTDTDRWMWALAWESETGWGQHLSRPVAGCVVVMEREGGGHVTTFEYEEGGYYYCRGGNQSDSVNLSKYSPSQVVGLVWPRAAGEAPGPDDVPVEDRPMLEYGDSGSDVFDLQDMLNAQSRAGLDVDGDFGPATKEAVINYQSTRQLEVDGIVGPETWQALYDEKKPVIPPAPPEGLTNVQQKAIRDIAANSEIADYSWKDRGQAPKGYIEGMALAFGQFYLNYKRGDTSAIEMGKKNTTNQDKDAIAWYNDVFRGRGMSNAKDGPDTLRHLWVLLLGLGMRESSGRHCEGRDMSADNVSSDTAEAGMFQTSYNAHSCSDEFDKLFTEYQAPGAPCYLETFKQGVSCSSSEWSCYGSGNGYKFQELCKSCPTFAAASCAITLRNLRQHYGPINRKEAEVRQEADELFKDVQAYLDTVEVGV
jgi:uncharacterized protein (TIGR02594 family)